MLQLASDEDSYAIDLRFVTKSQLKELISLLENPYYKKVGQNIKFDYQMLKKHYNVTLTNIADTMIIEQLLYLGRNFGFFKGFWIILRGTFAFTCKAQWTGITLRIFRRANKRTNIHHRLVMLIRM